MGQSDDPDDNPLAYRVKARMIDEKQRAHEEHMDTERQKLLDAEANGDDVCWQCGTINPERCSYGCCISGVYPCGDSYNGNCYIHDD